MKRLTESARTSARALSGVLSTLGMVYAAFKAGQWIGSKMLELTGRSPEQQKKEQEEILARAEQLKHFLKRHEEEEKSRLELINTEYTKQIRAIEQLTTKTEALARAREKAAQAGQDRRAAEIDAAEIVALAQGWDPDAVRLMYADERRRAQTDAVVESAQAGAAAAERAVQTARDRYASAVNRSLEFHSELSAAEDRQSELRRQMAALDTQALDEQELARKRRILTTQYSKAEISERQARHGLAGALEGEALAVDDIDIAQAEATAARAAVEAAMAARGKAELEYQADVEAFWQKQDDAERERQWEALEAMRRQQEERRRLQEEADREAHRRRVENAKAEVAAGETMQFAAQDRLTRARWATAQTWAWYRNPEAFAAQRREERADVEAQGRFSRDEDRLKRMSNWRTRELGDDMEAVRRVVLAREEERQAEQALAAIEINTRGLAQKLDQLLAMKDGG